MLFVDVSESWFRMENKSGTEWRHKKGIQNIVLSLNSMVRLVWAASGSVLRIDAISGGCVRVCVCVCSLRLEVAGLQTTSAWTLSSTTLVSAALVERHRRTVACRTPMKMLQSLNALASKISPGSPTDSNANKMHVHNNNNNVSNHHHPYLKKMAQPMPTAQPTNSDQKENT